MPGLKGLLEKLPLDSLLKSQRETLRRLRGETLRLTAKRKLLLLEKRLLERWPKDLPIPIELFPHTTKKA